MSRIFVHGTGAVSPAGWGMACLGAALEKGVPLPAQPLQRPGWEKPLCVRTVPPPVTRPSFLAHPRLRRSGVMSHHTVAAALEALGGDTARVQSGELRLGIIVCMLAGGVAYSRRFYEEVLRDPATASPLIFPETVFNAAASHLSAYLNSNSLSHTLVGDEGTFLQGVALAAEWLELGRADACLVVGAEELDWIVADAMRLFRRGTISSGGAGALYLKAAAAPVQLVAITDSCLFTGLAGRAGAIRKMQAQLLPVSATELLCDSGDGNPGSAGQRLTPKKILGEALAATAAWQCAAACDWIGKERYTAANVEIVGANQQAIGARFVRTDL